MNAHLQRQQQCHRVPTRPHCSIRHSSAKQIKAHATAVQAFRYKELSVDAKACYPTSISLPATAAAALAALTVVLPSSGAVQAATIPAGSTDRITESVCGVVLSTTTAPRLTPCQSCVAPPRGAAARLVDATTTTTNAPAGPAVEIPWPKAPSVPSPQTPPNSPLPTPDMPTPPFIPVPPPPSLPPQLLPPHPGNEPPPQRLIPNAPRSKIAFAAGINSSSGGGGGGDGPTKAADVPDRSGTAAAVHTKSSSNWVGLLGRFRQQQELQQQWQQALLWAASNEGAVSRLTLQEPPGLLLPGDIPLPFLDQSLTRENLEERLALVAQGSRRAMLATYAAADTPADPTSALQPDRVVSPTGASSSTMKVVVPGSSMDSNGTIDKGSRPARPVVTGFERNVVGVPNSVASSNQRRGMNDRDWTQQLQQIPAAAQRDPGISDLLKALARFADASVRLAVPLLRLLVQAAAALIRAVVKLIVWGLDKSHQTAVARVQDVRQGNVAILRQQWQQNDGGFPGSVAVSINAVNLQQVTPHLHHEQAWDGQMAMACPAAITK